MSWERVATAISSAPPAAVWLLLLDGRRWSQWNPGVEWMTLEGPLAPGTVVTLKPRGAPQTAFRIDAVLAPVHLALVVSFGPVARLRLSWELSAQGPGTLVLQTVTIAGPLAGPLLRRAAQRIAAGMGANLERLAALAAQRAG